MTNEIENLGIELQNGLSMETLTDQGTIFDIKVPESCQGDYDNFPLSYENFPQEELLKHSKPDLLGNESDDELDDLDITPFEKRLNEMEDITPDGMNLPPKSVAKQFLRPGVGEVLPKNSLVKVEYNAYLDHLDEPFDSTYLRGKSHTFRLGNGEVLPGLDIAVSSMKLNEKAEFLICPELAFGKFGCLARIPPDATILYSIEVKGYVDNNDMIEFENLSPEEQSAAKFPELMKVARAQHATGNNLVRRGMREKALLVYLQGIKLLENASYVGEEEEKEGHRVLLKLYVNSATTSGLTKKYRKCCKYANEALKLDSKNIKALYWLGFACTELSNWERAHRILMKALRIDNKNSAVIQALENLNQKKIKSDDGEKNLYKKMFPGFKTEKKNFTEVENSEFLESVEDAFKNFHLQDKPEPFVTKCTTKEEFDCFDFVAKKYDDIEIVKSKESVKIISKKE